MSYNIIVYAIRCILIRLAEVPCLFLPSGSRCLEEANRNTCTVLLFLRELTQHESEGFTGRERLIRTPLIRSSI